MSSLLTGRLTATGVTGVCRARLQIRRAEHKRHFSHLLREGQNPYEVQRRKQRAVAMRAQQRRVAAQLKRGRDAITAQLVMEESRHQAALQATARQQVSALARPLVCAVIAQKRAPNICDFALLGASIAKRVQAYDEKYQREMGSEASHAKVARYMRATTATKTDMLDPTSREHIAPSAATHTKQASFGLGGATDAVRERVRAKHSEDDSALIPALMPRDVQRLLEQGAPRLSAPGDAEDSMEDDTAQVHAVAECPGTWEEAPRGPERTGGAGKLSRFERRVR